MTPRALGLIGGMSWQSSAVYYRLVNEGVAARRGGLHSAPLLLHSVDFAPLAALLAAGDWPALAQHLGRVGAGLQRAGAGALMLATNTMHKVAGAIEAEAGLPLLHIADATGAALRAAGVACAALLGTRFTMTDEAIVRAPLAQRHGVRTLVPEASAQALINTIVFDELCRGRIEPASRAALQQVLRRLQQQGAQAVVLSCTELMLLLGQADVELPLFDGTALHAQAAVDWLCAGARDPASDPCPGSAGAAPES